MKRFRATFILALVVALFMGLAIYKDHYDQVQTEGSLLLADASGAVGAAFSFEKTDSIKVEQRAESFSLKKQNDAWSLEAPASDDGDESAILEYLASLNRYKFEVVETDGQPIDFAKFGLIDPRATITIGFNGGERRVLKVGHVRSFDQGYYFQIGENLELLKGDNSFTSILAKSSKDFRIKNIKLQHLRVQEITISSRGQVRVQLRRENGEWRAVQPSDVPVDSNSVQKYLVAIKNLRATDFLFDQSDEPGLKKTGLTNPDLKIQLSYLTPKGGAGLKKVDDIKISNSNDGPSAAENKEPNEVVILVRRVDNEYLALGSSSNKPIYKLNIGDFQTLNIGIGDFRDKKAPVRFDLGSVQEIEINKSKKEEATRLVKSDKVWTIKNDKSKSVDPAAVDHLLESMFLLTVDGFSKLKLPEAKIEKGIKLIGSDEKLLLQIDLMSTDQSPHLSGSTSDSKKTNLESLKYYLAKSNLSKDIFFIAKSKVDELFEQKLTLEKKAP